MKSGEFLSNVIKGSWVFLLFVAIVSTEALCADRKLDSEKYLKAVEKFADSVIEHGRDVYGSKHTPLFVDGLQVETLEPAEWKLNPFLHREWVWARQREGWSKEKISQKQAEVQSRTCVSSNFANQQALLRTLDGVTGLTGEKKYRQAAKEATGYALKNVTSPNGLLYWGGHMSWDLLGEKPMWDSGHAGIHEMKFHQPYFRFMWDVNRQATSRFMNSFWGSHIRDWNTLNFKRHGGSNRPAEPQWDHNFDTHIEVPFPGKGFSFGSTMLSFMHITTMLSLLDQDDDAMKWSERLVYRWQQLKHPKTGLSGGQLNYSPSGDRAKSALGHIYPSINEANILASYHPLRRYHQLPLVQMQNGEILLKAGGKYAELGCKYIVWALEDLKIYTNKCYDPKTGQFKAMMTDGTILDGKKSKKGYYGPESFLPRDPDACLMWGHAMAYRISKDKAHWDMARTIGKFMKIGDIGLPGGKERALNFDIDQLNWRLVYTLFELYRAEGDRSILKLACRIGDNLLKLQRDTGLFPRPGRNYARTGDEIPLVLLHLAATIDGKNDKIVEPIFDEQFFACLFNHLDKDLPENLVGRLKNDPGAKYSDNALFYGQLVIQ